MTQNLEGLRTRREMREEHVGKQDVAQILDIVRQAEEHVPKANIEGPARRRNVAGRLSVEEVCQGAVKTQGNAPRAGTGDQKTTEKWREATASSSRTEKPIVIYNKYVFSCVYFLLNFLFSFF